MRAWLLLVGILTLLGCETPPPSPYFETWRPDSESTGLQRLEGSDFQYAWARSGTALAHYDGIWLRHTEPRYCWLQRQPGHRYECGRHNYALPPRLYLHLLGAVQEIFDEELVGSAGFRGATGPGRGVLAADVSIVDLAIYAPLDRPGGEYDIYVDQLGAMTIVIDLRDSISEAAIARVAERRQIETMSRRPMRVDPGAAIYETRRLLRLWASRLRALIDMMTETEIASAPPAP